MKITIISLDNWGFNQKLVPVLEKMGHEVNHINFHLFKFKYNSIFERIKNGFQKVFFNKNIKKEFRAIEIEKRLQILPKQDIILTIKGDFISSDGIKTLKKYSNKSIAFFNDNIARYPRTVDVLPYFDEVFSFEKADCEKYNLKFAPNFIYNFQEFNQQNNFEFDVFTIASLDKRSKILIQIAKKLQETNQKIKFILFSKKKYSSSKAVEYSNQTLPLEVVNEYISKSKALVDINRKGQNGLSFRVFESLGLHKKLLTTNTDILNYDFYNPNNIVLLLAGCIEIPKDFFTTPYQEISKEIITQYTMEGWLNKVLFSNK